MHPHCIHSRESRLATTAPRRVQQIPDTLAICRPSSDKPGCGNRLGAKVTNENLFDVLVIGAGIAGASVAAELARDARVALLEMESQPGYHTTGRSAAMFAPTYGPQAIRALTRASQAFFRSPPEGFSDRPLLSRRGLMMVARHDQLPALDVAIAELAGEAKVERLDAEAARIHCPLLREGYAAGGYYQPDTSGIDVNALHQGYLRALKTRGGTLAVDFPVQTLARQSGLWTAASPATEYRAPLVVNAAGAWADKVGAIAGAEKIGLVPKRRSVLIIKAPDGVAVDRLPLVVDMDEGFYLKPDAGRLLISPANEDPDVPSDVQPDELDIAICIDRIERAFDLQVGRIENRWAGLRNFVADKTPVAGFSEMADGFFWLAGQGGYGIQSAPALSRYAAAALLGHPIPADILSHGLDPASLSVARLT